MKTSDLLLPAYEKDVFKKEVKASSEQAFSWVGIIVTSIASSFWAIGFFTTIGSNFNSGNIASGASLLFVATIIIVIIYGNLVYQIARLGYFKRLSRHKSVIEKELDTIFDPDLKAPMLTMLIPSYKEESRVIKQAILSTALQDYPLRRVVLLIDDPPNPKTSEDRSNLERSRKLPKEISEIIKPLCQKYTKTYNKFRLKERTDQLDPRVEFLGISEIHFEIAQWFESQADRSPVQDHSDTLFSKLTFVDRAKFHRRKAHDFFCKGFSNLSVERDWQRQVRKEYYRLASLFNVEITCFERKQYENLSHAPNKAMNLNSYIGMIGNSFKEVKRDRKILLESTNQDDASLIVPDSDYIITLDADSILSFDYALRLIHEMEQQGNEKIAVIQTPYSAVPNAPTLLERAAGATTDIQYIVHQGFTNFKSTYWVGANAVLRKTALDDIAIEEEERGYRINKFIQDRTVIEDTESSLDLIDRGWSLFNYPERLSYSATPPDFGSLLIQRRRWANGGLIILPKLFRYLFRVSKSRGKFFEGFMRLNYLISIAGTNIGILFIFAYPMDDQAELLWLPITAAPYFVLYGRDLLQAGFRIKDLFRVYALNLMLIPVNLGGVLKSIQQALTGKQIPFNRTPKVGNRTPVPKKYIAAEYTILIYCFISAVFDFMEHRWMHATFALVNSFIFWYAIKVFIGFQESLKDLFNFHIKFNFSALVLKRKLPIVR